jgi:Zn-finger nucleic acid-binding protein
MNILPKDDFMPYMNESLAFIKKYVGNGFDDMEYEKFRRVVTYMETTTYSDAKLVEGRKDFYNWFNEYDRRRKVTFLETFPEMIDFYNLCKEVANENR